MRITFSEEVPEKSKKSLRWLIETKFFEGVRPKVYSSGRGEDKKVFLFDFDGKNIHVRVE